MIRYIIAILIITVTFSCKRGHKVPSHQKNDRERSYSNTRQNRANVVKMQEDNGIYRIPIEINNIRMNIIFDTGASSISISETEALFLMKQGKIEQEDILGKIRFQDATGNISEGTRINLKTVKIGNKEIYNVEASVVHNLEAPLLLGQSALSKFGKLTIDYKRNEIIFE